MAVREFQKNDVIFHQGDEGTTFFQIMEGSVGIFVNYDGSEDVKLAEVPKGEFVGEMAVIDAAPRSGSAVALADGTKLKEIRADELNAYFKEEPDNIVLLMKMLSKRLRDLTAEYEKAKDMAAKLNVEGSSTDAEVLRTARKYAFYYASRRTPIESAEVVREEMKHSEGFSKNVVAYPKGTVICKEGDTVQCMYDIHWGRVGIYSNFGKEDQVHLTTLAADEFFGEMGMIDDAPRSATAVAIDDNTTVEIIYPEDFAELFEKNPMKVNLILSHISTRLRTLTSQYCTVCEKISQKMGCN